MIIRIKFCLTNGEGGEEVGAESVWVEGEAVVDQCRAEIFQRDSLFNEGENYQLIDECRAEMFHGELLLKWNSSCSLK